MFKEKEMAIITKLITTPPLIKHSKQLDAKYICNYVGSNNFPYNKTFNGCSYGMQTSVLKV